MSMFTEIINPFINVRNQVKNSSGSWVDESVKTENSRVIKIESYNDNNPIDFTREVFTESNKKIIIETLVFKSDSNMGLRLENVSEGPYRSSNDLFWTVGGATSYMATFDSVQNRGNAFLEHSTFEVEENYRTLTLKRPVTIPNGGRLVIDTPIDLGDDDNLNYSLAVYYRTIEE